MSVDWQELKTNVWRWYLRVSAFWMAQTVIVYLWACMVAGKPVGPKDYIKFNYHVIQWRSQGAAAVVRPVAAGALYVPSRLNAAPRVSAPASAAAVSYIRTNQKTELRSGKAWSADVVAVLDAGTPVRLVANFAHQWEEIEEIVQDGRHPPAHGYVQAAFLDFPQFGER